MTWLFTQVWLWSLAAFVLGFLITWMLFVLPLRKRLRAAVAQQERNESRESKRDRSERDRSERDRPEQDPPEKTAVELLPARHQDEDLTFGDWDRERRSWNSRKPEPPAVKVPASGPDWEIPDWAGPADTDTREVERVLASEAEPDWDRVSADGPFWLEERPEWAARSGEIGTDDLPTKQRPVGPPQLEASGLPDMDQVVLPAQRPTTPSDFGQIVLPELDSPAESEPAGSNAGESHSTWFQKAADEPGRAEDVSARADQAESSEPMQSQLRSLFEPLASPDPGSARPDPIEISETQNIPKIEEPPEGAEVSPLPRRTPGAGPRPGAQNLNGAAQRRAEAAAAEINLPEAAKPEHGPNDGMIKGHFASRQYHTPDSPQYGRIVAQVWFRTPAEAEQAGFEAWNSRGSA